MKIRDRQNSVKGKFRWRELFYKLLKGNIETPKEHLIMRLICHVKVA